MPQTTQSPLAQLDQDPIIHLYRLHYASGYRLVTFIRFVGFIAYAIAVLVVLGGLIAGAESNWRSPVPVMVGTGLGLFWVLIGVALQGFASVLKAVTDTAVHTVRVLHK